MSRINYIYEINKQSENRKLNIRILKTKSESYSGEIQQRISRKKVLQNKGEILKGIEEKKLKIKLAKELGKQDNNEIKNINN